MIQAMREGESVSGQVLRGVARPLVSVAGLAVSAAAGFSAAWTVGMRAAGTRLRASPVRARRGRI